MYLILELRVLSQKFVIISSIPHHFTFCMALFFLANPLRIRVRHEHGGLVNRPMMLMFPIVRDYEVQLLAFCDGRYISAIRTYGTGLPYPIEKDIAIFLYSPHLLPVSAFPKPAHYYVLPNNHPHNMVAKLEMFLAYNGVPDCQKEIKRYPNAPKNELVKTLGELFGDRLSISKGMANASYDRDNVSYKISSHSGAGLF
jgi:hypothetical protein